MRKFLVVLVLVFCFGFVFLGCASVQKSVDYYKACKADSACYAQMVEAGNVSASLTRVVAKSTNLEDWLASIAFNLASGLAGVFLGRKMKRC